MGKGETDMKNWGERGSISAIVSSVLLLITSILLYVSVKQGVNSQEEGAYSVVALVMMIMAVITLSLGAYSINVVQNKHEIYLSSKAEEVQHG